MSKTRFHTAVSLALDVLHDHVRITAGMMQDAAEKQGGIELYDALNVAAVARERIEAMRGRKYGCYDHVSVELAVIGSLLTVIARAVGERDDPLGSAAKGGAGYVDVLLHMLELAEGGAK